MFEVADRRFLTCHSSQTGQIACMGKSWQLQEAKDQFSTVVERALTVGHQVVTRHGKPAVVVVSVDEFRRLQPRAQSLSRFLADSPLRDLGGAPKRRRDTPRAVPL
jgi:prevent-host-death family protein